ncbi:MAG: hypothetical protein BGP14_13875 [Sphingobacteriales bacterium 44-15]|nr:MAG: hypothetical protein BGP14_13875 [Sphingobacteriales bacterium 44-15]
MGFRRENRLFVNLNYREGYKIITPPNVLRAVIRILKIRTDMRRSNPQIYQLQRLLLPTFGWDRSDEIVDYLHALSIVKAKKTSTLFPYCDPNRRSGEAISTL